MTLQHKLPGLLREFLPTTLLVLGIFACRSTLADWYTVPTGSMLPTIVEGDRILVDKLAYDVKLPFSNIIVSRLQEPQIGDIVVFEHPTDGKRMVKRLVAGPGDTIAMRDNRLILNGKAVSYQASGNHIYEDLGTRHTLQWLKNGNPYTSFAAVTLGNDEYLMLGDNRNNSTDSRFFGVVPRELLQGKAERVLFSKVPEQLAVRKERALKKLI